MTVSVNLSVNPSETSLTVTTSPLVPSAPGNPPVIPLHPFIRHDEGLFQGDRGMDLYYQRWQPCGTRAIIAMVHGIGAHSGLFESAVHYLASQGFGIYAFDLRGHGRSPGQRGYINSWTEFRNDLQSFIQLIHQHHPGCATFVWGHSLGGTIVLDYALQASSLVKGIIVSAPALEKVGISPMKLFLGRSLSRVWPRFSLKLGIQNQVCARDPQVCLAYTQDPLRHEYGSARLATEFLSTVNRIQSRAPDLQMPLLLMHGSNDQVTLPESSRHFFQQVTFPDKLYREYHGNDHDLPVDITYDRIFPDVQAWIDQHLQGSPSCEMSSECAA